MSTYIHYGSNSFKEEKFQPALSNERIDFGNKPIQGSGLWASPLGSKWGWRDWCEVEGFRKEGLGSSFLFELKKNTRILTIDGFEDFNKIITDNKYSREGTLLRDGSRYFNFNKIRKDFDVIYLTKKGEQETRFSEPGNLYGWDCECILVLNRGIIVPIT